jgi:intracellular sulfur oxidation DsrE/DsrF family protein
MEQSTFKTHRRSFLGTLASGAAALGLMGLSPLRLQGSEALAASVGADDHETWFNQIKGKHRIVYDATDTNEALPLAWSWVFLNTNNETGSADTDLTVMVVVRHSAIPMVMNDHLWAKYKFGEFFKLNDPKTGAASSRNYFWNSQEGDLMKTEWSIDRLQKRGVLFCVCNMALTVYSGFFAKGMGGNAEEIKQDWLAGLHPGIKVVPSGVWALGRAQEHGCQYCYAGG